MRHHFRFGDPNPEGKELSEAEIFRLLELFRSCLLGKRAVQGVVKRTKKNIHEFQRDTYQLGILTLNLGHINRVPYIGGSSKFPKWVRTDINYRVLPHLVFRNAAHIVCLCEASDEHGGIAVHRECYLYLFKYVLFGSYLLCIPNTFWLKLDFLFGMLHFLFCNWR